MTDEAYQKCPSWFNSQIYAADSLQKAMYYLPPLMRKLESKATMLGSFKVEFIRSKKRIDDHRLVLEYSATIDRSNDVRFIHLEFLPRATVIYWFGKVSEENKNHFNRNGQVIFHPKTAHISELEDVIEEYLKSFPKEYF